MESADSEGKIELLVIGYGNTLRRDDSVGPRVAEEIENFGIRGLRGLSCMLLTPELAARIAEAKRVVFVDATVKGGTEVELKQVLPTRSSQVLGHSATPGTLLAIAREMFGRVPEAWVLAIPVEDIEVGDNLSELARTGMKAAIERIKQMGQGSSSGL